eukprot:1437621-Ditylum_brightwellii.AAC.1
MAKQQLQPDYFEFVDIYGAPIISLDNNIDGITGVDDTIVKETIEQHDTPSQIIGHEEIYDLLRPSDHT